MLEAIAMPEPRLGHGVGFPTREVFSAMGLLHDQFNLRGVQIGFEFAA
jgi:hypothetical protein